MIKQHRLSGTWTEQTPDWNATCDAEVTSKHNYTLLCQARNTFAHRCMFAVCWILQALCLSISASLTAHVHACIGLSVSDRLAAAGSLPIGGIGWPVSISLLSCLAQTDWSWLTDRGWLRLAPAGCLIDVR